jgi:hypothetical protein
MKIGAIKVTSTLIASFLFLFSDFISNSEIKATIQECQDYENSNETMQCSYKLNIKLNLYDWVYPSNKNDQNSPLNFSIAEIIDSDGQIHSLEKNLIIIIYEKIILNNNSSEISPKEFSKEKNNDDNTNSLSLINKSNRFLYFKYSNFSDILQLHLQRNIQINNGRYFQISLNKMNQTIENKKNYFNIEYNQLQLDFPIEMLKIFKYKSQAQINKLEVIKSNSKDYDAILKIQVENIKNQKGSFSLFFECSQHIFPPESIFFTLKSSEYATLEKKIYVGSQYATRHFCNVSLYDSEGSRIQEIFQKFECKAKVYSYNLSEPLIEKRDSYIWEDIMEEATKLFLFSPNQITTYFYKLLVDPDIQDNNRALMIYEKDVDYVSCQIVEMFHSSFVVLVIFLLLLKAR